MPGQRSLWRSHISTFLFNPTLDEHVEYRNTREYACLSIIPGRNDIMLFLRPDKQVEQ